uniref:Uncharacterized protein n=1 Tax=Arundo donax TaxID=35708 RepID=A0A0A9E8U7_ARUDO
MSGTRWWGCMPNAGSSRMHGGCLMECL